MGSCQLKKANFANSLSHLKEKRITNVLEQDMVAKVGVKQKTKLKGVATALVRTYLQTLQLLQD